MLFFEVFLPLSNPGNVLLQLCAELEREISSQGCCMCNLHSHGHILPSHYPQEQPPKTFPLHLLRGTWMNTDRPQRPANEPQFPCGNFILLPCFQQKYSVLQWVLLKLFYLSPLVGADVPKGCSSPRAEDHGPVRPPAPLHLWHQGLEQCCDDSCAAGPSLPTITLQTAVMASNDDVSVWNEELKKTQKNRMQADNSCLNTKRCSLLVYWWPNRVSV